MSRLCQCNASSAKLSRPYRPPQAFTRASSCTAVRRARQCRLTSTRSTVSIQARVIEEKGEGDCEGGTGVLDRPDFGGGTTTLTPSTESSFGATDVGGSKELGGGDYRVLLLDDETHTEQHVVDVITTVVATVDEQQARNCFATSKQLGQAMVTSCLKEHAELYTDQMRRKGCKASMEPDTTTM